MRRREHQLIAEISAHKPKSPAESLPVNYWPGSLDLLLHYGGWSKVTSEGSYNVFNHGNYEPDVVSRMNFRYGPVTTLYLSWWWVSTWCKFVTPDSPPYNNTHYQYIAKVLVSVQFILETESL